MKSVPETCPSKFYDCAMLSKLDRLNDFAHTNHWSIEQLVLACQAYLAYAQRHYGVTPTSALQIDAARIWQE